MTNRTPAALAFALGAALALTPAQAQDAAEGRRKAAQCQTCHGIDGIAKIPIAPHIAGESFVYLQTQLRNFRSGRRTHEIMTIVAKDLSDQDIDDLAAWYSAIAFAVTLPERAQ